MVELACAPEPAFVPSTLEEGEAASYSIWTVEKLHRDYTSVELFFLIGADAFAEIHTWKRWRELLTLTCFIVASRPGALYAIPAGARVHRIEMDIDISSSRIRQMLAKGALDLPVPGPVKDYIFERHLYASHNSSK